MHKWTGGGQGKGELGEREKERGESVIREEKQVTGEEGRLNLCLCSNEWRRPLFPLSAERLLDNARLAGCVYLQSRSARPTVRNYNQHLSLSFSLSLRALTAKLEKPHTHTQSHTCTAVYTQSIYFCIGEFAFPISDSIPLVSCVFRVLWNCRHRSKNPKREDFSFVGCRNISGEFRT